MKAPVLLFLVVAAVLLATVPTSALPASPANLPASDEKGPGEDAFTIGVSAGDAYSPYSLALDPGRNLAYVYHATSDKGPAAIAAVDLGAGEVKRLIYIGDKPLGPGRLLVSPDGRRLFLHEAGGNTVSTIDAQTGAVKKLLDGARDIALSEDGKLLFVAGEKSLSAYPLPDILTGKTRARWQSATSFNRIALNGGRLLGAAYAGDRLLVVYDATTGTQLARAATPWDMTALSPGPDGGWAFAVGGEKSRLIRYDAALKPVGETAIPYAYDVSYDPLGNRFLLNVSRMDGSGWSGRGYGVTLAIDGTDGRVTQETRWPGPHAPTAFTRWSDEAVLAFQIGGAARLSVLDSASLAPQGAIAMGARVDDAVIDGDRMLYVADDLGRVHLLALPEGQEVELWQGGGPMALDAANGRLYVNRESRVVALDLRDGSVVAEFPQGGYAAPDPNRNVVYIADRGVTVYDRGGKKLGDLPSTFPDPKGFSPNPYAYAAQVNPVTGHVAVTFFNGIPGSNGGSFLRIYEPQSDKFVLPRAPHSFVMDLLSDSKGNWWVAYSTARNQEAAQVLAPDGKELRRLDHRTGFLALDERSDNLYLFTEGRVTRLAASTLTALEALRGPDTVAGLTFSPAASIAYLFDRSGPRIRATRLADLPPLDLKPVAGSPSPYSNSYGLAVTVKGKTRALVGWFDRLYRSRDGKTWQKLLPGLDLQYANVTAVDGGTIFVTGRTLYGGEGVWRSKDGGATWEWLVGGLTDLAPWFPVLARSADEAYFFNKGQGLLGWDAAGRKWQLATALAEGEGWTSLTLAPDGALFRARMDYLERSVDRGATWERLGPTAKTGEVIGFSALYTVTQTIFSSVRSADYRITAIQRSPDGGETWQPSLTAEQVNLGGMPPVLATGFGRTYLLTQPYQGNPTLLRTTDFGDTWQLAPAGTAKDAQHIAVDPLDGRLWLGVRGGARQLNPEKLRWTKVALPATPTPEPSARAAPGSPTPSAALRIPTPGPCELQLSGADAELDARGLGLGCPTEPARTVPMARQKFQNGQMIWHGHFGWIYILYNDGTWTSYPDQWFETHSESDPSITAPEGLQQPIRGFGKVWREELGGPNAKIGWALEKEQGVEGQYQDWSYGQVFRFGGETLILLDRGEWR